MAVFAYLVLTPIFFVTVANEKSPSGQVIFESDVTDIRRNTQSPQFEDALSVGWYNGILYWTTGQSVVIEEYNAAQDSYYQNSYDVSKVHQPCTRLMIVHPDLQPTPVPMAPPQRVQVIYGQTQARVSWRPPPVISGLGSTSPTIVITKTRTSRRTRLCFVEELRLTLEALLVWTHFFNHFP